MGQNEYVATNRDERLGDDASSSERGDVALLIDYENLQISLKRLFNLTTPQMSLIIQEVQEYGRLVLARAYAPWTSPDLSIDAENLYRQGIDLIYVPSGKNSADVRMAVDAVETSGRASNISTYVIVTGDGDLIHPLNFLRQHGKRVVVIGVDAAMSRMLSSAADAVLLYERDLDPSVRRRGIRRQPSRATSPSATRTVEDTAASAKPRLTPLRDHAPAEAAFAMVRDVLQRRSNDEPVLFQELGHWLSQEFGLRPRAWYGVPFSTFMEAAEAEGFIRLTQSGGNNYASLPSVDAGDIADETGDDDRDSESADGTGSRVRLESLLPEERRDLFDALRAMQEGKRSGYLSFRTIRNALIRDSVLPRLSEQQVHALLNDLANRNPPILIRSQKQRRAPNGQSYSFATFTLTRDDALVSTGE